MNHAPATIEHSIESQPAVSTSEQSIAPVRIGRLGKAAIVAFGIYATLKSGGLADRAIDPFQSARHVVTSDLIDDSMRHVEQQSLDGIPFSEYPVEAQQSIKAENQLEIDAANRIAQTMSDLDNHNYDAITTRGEAFREAHAAEIMPSEQKDSYLEQLKHTKSSAESVKLLDDFMQFYGKTAGFHEVDDGAPIGTFNPDTSNGDVQPAVSGIIQALWYLPKPFVASANFETVEIGNAKGLTMGDYDYDSHSLLIATHSRQGRVLIKTLNGLPNAIQDSETIRHDILHELGHSKAAESAEPISTPPLKPNAILKQVGQEIINYPGNVTQYATTSPEEAYAEAFADAFNVLQGPIHPDDARHFASGASKQILEALAPYEQTMPGLTDYLVSMNPRLTGNNLPGQVR